MRTMNQYIPCAIYCLFLSLNCAASQSDWITPELIYQGSSNQTVLYADIAVDNRLYPPPYIPGYPTYGRSHVVFSAFEDSVWRTYYKVYDDVDGWSYLNEVDKEPIGVSQYKTWSSDVPTRPGISVDTVDDLADIVFLQQKTDWYYPNDPFPSWCIPESEILFVWKYEAAWPNKSINPPDQIHHVSGLQKGMSSPSINYTGFGHTAGYRNAVFWSQNDGADPDFQDVIYNYQAGSANKDRKGIEWGDQTIAGDPFVSDKPEPYFSVGFNRTASPAEPETNMLSVVYSTEDGISCSICNVPGHMEIHEWRTFSISPSQAYYNLDVPSCAFEFPDDPSTDPPDLHVVYRAWTTATNSFVYMHRRLQNTWSENPSWSKETPIVSISAALWPSVPAAGPVIAFSENNVRHIAYIGDDFQVFVQDYDGSSTTTFQITTPDDDSDGENHMWLRYAVDTVSSPTGYCGHLVFDGVDDEGYRNIYWAREDR